METQLAFDDQDKQLGLRFREKLVTDLGIVCKVQLVPELCCAAACTKAQRA